jgi:aryl-alcohol dehydrogenase-like predicted oxidoreductase
MNKSGKNRFLPRYTLARGVLQNSYRAEAEGGERKDSKGRRLRQKAKAKKGF